MILTDNKGIPIEKPKRADFESDSEFIRAFHAYKDKVTNIANTGFSEGFTKGQKAKPMAKKKKRKSKKAKSAHRPLALLKTNLRKVQAAISRHPDRNK